MIPSPRTFWSEGLWDVLGWPLTWYDIAIAPNLELYNHVRKTASPAVADKQWLIIAPVGHCAFTRATEKTIVGERDMGDARLPYQDIMYSFFELTLKGQKSSKIESMPKVTYYTMGSNRWQTSNVWPPANTEPMTFFLSSAGKANTKNGDGAPIIVIKLISDKGLRVSCQLLDLNREWRTKWIRALGVVLAISGARQDHDWPVWMKRRVVRRR